MFGNRLDKKYRKGKAAGFVLLFIVMVLLVSAIVQWLWNAVLPEVLPVKPIRYPQAIALLVLCRILFGGLGFRGKGEFNRRQGLREKLSGMTPEERQHLREEWAKRCRK